MNPERWGKVETLYHAALERPPEARAAFLAEACAGDDELRCEVTALLAYDDSDTGFLEAPAVEAAARVLVTSPHAETRTGLQAEPASADTPIGGSCVRDALCPGQMLQHFRILAKVGTGGMGEVYLAEDLKLGRRVALKLVPAGTNPDLQARQRFLREARAASALNHPNIVTIHAVEEADGLDFLVMEYVEGETLDARIARGPLEPAPLLSFGLQVAEAVAAAHALGIIHRDLKPGNILITADGRVKVLDFGLATKVRLPTAPDTGVSRLTDTGVVVGTVPYMSPEQTRGEALDARSDLFSLGCVLYEAATGRRPFTGPSALAIMHAIATEDPPPPSALRRGLPLGIDGVVRRTLAKDKEHRYGSAAELIAALRDLSVPEKEARRRFRRRIRAGVAAALVVAVAVGVWLFWHQANRTWARESLARVEELANAEKYFEAYDLAVRAEKYLPDDPTLARLMPTIADELSVITEPRGAHVYLRRFARDDSGQFPPRQLVGTTPIRDLRIGRGEYILAVEKEGYAPFQRTISSTLDRLENGLWERGELREVSAAETPSGAWKLRLDASAPLRVELKLIEAAKMPERMVFVPGSKYQLHAWGKPTSTEVHLDDYFIDQFEVSNREYKEFMSAGGYQRKEFWKHPFLKDGKQVSWEEASKLLTDRTGLPGPRGWSNQEFPEGKADHPVTEITWYEAAAYAEFRGKQLPTVFQWEKAARNGASTVFWGLVMPWGLGGVQASVDDRANFNSRGTVPVDSREFGMSPFGCYHMAGNVAEWCHNGGPRGYATTGGSWNDPLYLYAHYGQFPGFYSANTLGFRCVRTAAPAAGDQGGMPLSDAEEVPHHKPVGEAEYKTFLRFYQYDPAPLKLKILEVTETADWRRERISYVGAGGEAAFRTGRLPERTQRRISSLGAGEETALAYLWLPKHFRQPLQVINYKPGSAVYSGLTVPQEVEVVCGPFLKSGRAVFVIVLPGMKERKRPPGFVEPAETSVGYRDLVVHDTIDQLRGLDYLATRPEVDLGRLACFGLSQGGYDLVHMAVERRYRSFLLLSAGIAKEQAEGIAEANPVHFAPYIRGPKLMIQGRFDESGLLKTMAEPLFELLAEPKRLKILETGHFPRWNCGCRWPRPGLTRRSGRCRSRSPSEQTGARQPASERLAGTRGQRRNAWDRGFDFPMGSALAQGTRPIQFGNRRQPTTIDSLSDLYGGCACHHRS
jgi:formylglycine-generating enzyme required for sulfatase activity